MINTTKNVKNHIIQQKIVIYATNVKKPVNNLKYLNFHKITNNNLNDVNDLMYLKFFNNSSNKCNNNKYFQ